MFNKKPVKEEWEIREDARVLARAEEIKQDKERLDDAQRMAKQLAKEELKRVNGILKVAGKKPPVIKDDDPLDGKKQPPFNPMNRGSNPATVGKLW